MIFRFHNGKWINAIEDQTMVEYIYWLDSFLCGVLVGLVMLSFLYYFNYSLKDGYDANIFYLGVLLVLITANIGTYIARTNYNNYSIWIKRKQAEHI
jgi:hypothetical protein